MNLFFFDIETACGYPDYETFSAEDERGSKLFHSKYKRMNWEEKYSGIEEAYLEQGGIISTYGRIVCISFGYIDDNDQSQIRSFYGEDEKDIVYDINSPEYIKYKIKRLGSKKPLCRIGSDEFYYIKTTKELEQLCKLNESRYNQLQQLLKGTEFSGTCAIFSMWYSFCVCPAIFLFTHFISLVY